MDTSNQRKKRLSQAQPRAWDWPLPNSWREQATTYFGVETKKSSKRWPRSLTKQCRHTRRLCHSRSQQQDSCNAICGGCTSVVGTPWCIGQQCRHLPARGCDHRRRRKIEKLIETNLYSAYHLSRAFYCHKSGENQSAHIINICSIASLEAYLGGGATASQNLRSWLQIRPFVQSWCKKALKYLPFCRERPGQTAGGA